MHGSFIFRKAISPIYWGGFNLNFSWLWGPRVLLANPFPIPETLEIYQTWTNYIGRTHGFPSGFGNPPENRMEGSNSVQQPLPQADPFDQLLKWLVICWWFFHDLHLNEHRASFDERCFSTPGRLPVLTWQLPLSCHEIDLVDFMTNTVFDCFSNVDTRIILENCSWHWKRMKSLFSQWFIINIQNNPDMKCCDFDFRPIKHQKCSKHPFLNGTLIVRKRQQKNNTTLLVWNTRTQKTELKSFERNYWIESGWWSNLSQWTSLTNGGFFSSLWIRGPARRPLGLCETLRESFEPRKKKPLLHSIILDV